MRVSVIIACYNQSAYIGRALQSVRQQSLQDWEAIVVDDGSTDNSMAVAQEIAQEDTRIRVLHKENGGSGSARNMGLDAAKGEYIQFLDADDTLHPDKLERQIKRMEEEKSELSYTDFTFFDEEGHYGKVKGVKLTYRRVLLRWGLGYSVPLHAFLYKSSLIGSFRFDPVIRQREDWYWGLHMLQAVRQPLHVPICGAYYYQNLSGKTGNPVRMQRGNFLFMEQMLERLHGMDKLGMMYRMSEELWIRILRILKTRNKELWVARPRCSWHTVLAICLMPISIFSIAAYTHTEYIKK